MCGSRAGAAGALATIDADRVAASHETLAVSERLSNAAKFGDLRAARAALDLGFYISFSGILTFKNAQDLRDVAAFVPLDRMLIETDSPYLAPVPYRGKTNNPSYVPFVAAQIASVRACPVALIAEHTSRNFEILFKGVLA